MSCCHISPLFVTCKHNTHTTQTPRRMSMMRLSPEESQPMVGDDKPSKMKVVPAWMYNRENDVCGYWTLPGFLWSVNFIACIFHSILILITILVSTSGGRGLDTPTLTIYSRKLTWDADAADASSMLTPELEPAGWKMPISIVTVVFFGLSAFFHGFICLMNFSQAFATEDVEARKIGHFTGWYYKNLCECRQPMRWIECEFHFPPPPISSCACSPLSPPFSPFSPFSSPISRISPRPISKCRMHIMARMDPLPG